MQISGKHEQIQNQWTRMAVEPKMVLNYIRSKKDLSSLFSLSPVPPPSTNARSGGSGKRIAICNVRPTDLGRPEQPGCGGAALPLRQEAQTATKATKDSQDEELMVGKKKDIRDTTRACDGRGRSLALVSVRKGALDADGPGGTGP